MLVWEEGKLSPCKPTILALSQTILFALTPTANLGSFLGALSLPVFVSFYFVLLLGHTIGAQGLFPSLCSARSGYIWDARD